MSITALAEIVDRHNWEPTTVNARFPFRAGCSCGWIGEAKGGDKAHSVHVAIEIEEYVAARVAEALAPIEALYGGEPPPVWIADTKIVRVTRRDRRLGCDITESMVRVDDLRAELRAAMEGRLTDAPDARTHGLNHAPLPPGKWLAPGFCNGCDEERARATVEPTL